MFDRSDRIYFLKGLKTQKIIFKTFLIDIFIRKERIC